MSNSRCFKLLQSHFPLNLAAHFCGCTKEKKKRFFVIGCLVPWHSLPTLPLPLPKPSLLCLSLLQENTSELLRLWQGASWDLHQQEDNGICEPVPCGDSCGPGCRGFTLRATQPTQPLLTPPQLEGEENLRSEMRKVVSWDKDSLTGKAKACKQSKIRSSFTASHFRQVFRAGWK